MYLHFLTVESAKPYSPSAYNYYNAFFLFNQQNDSRFSLFLPFFLVFSHKSMQQRILCNRKTKPQVIIRLKNRFYISPAANTGGFYELLFIGKYHPLDSHCVARTRLERRDFLLEYFQRLRSSHFGCFALLLI